MSAMGKFSENLVQLPALDVGRQGGLMGIYGEPLSKRIGVATQETVVSRLIAAALGSPHGKELLGALLGVGSDDIEVLVTGAEVTVDGSRFDVVVVYKEREQVHALAIEAKVKAEEGYGQLDRYLEAVESDAFVEKVLELPVRPSVEWDRSRERIEYSTLLYLTVVKEKDVEGDVEQRTYTKWQERLDLELLDREGDLATRLLVDTLSYLGGRLGEQAEFVSNISASTPLKEFSEQDWSEFELEKQLSRQVSGVFLDLFAGFNSEIGSDGFGGHWASRGNWSWEFAYYKTSWRNHCSFWPSGETGQLSSLIWNIEPASLGSEDPKIRLRVRFQVEPYHKKAQFEKKPAIEVDSFRNLKGGFGDKVKALAKPIETLGYKNHWSEHQVGFVEVHLDSDGTLRDAARAVWNKSLELVPLIDEALESLRGDEATEPASEKGTLSAEPWTTDHDESRRPSFQLDGG